METRESLNSRNNYDNLQDLIDNNISVPLNAVWLFDYTKWLISILQKYPAFNQVPAKRDHVNEAIKGGRLNII